MQITQQLKTTFSQRLKDAKGLRKDFQYPERDRRKRRRVHPFSSCKIKGSKRKRKERKLVTKAQKNYPNLFFVLAQRKRGEEDFQVIT